MADFDAKKVTKLMEERATGYASADTAAKELMEMTGLDYGVAKAFCSNQRHFDLLRAGRVVLDE